MRWNIPEQSGPSSPRCEYPAAASCTRPWPVSIHWRLGPHNLPSGGASVGSNFLPWNVPGDTKKNQGCVLLSGCSTAVFTHWWTEPPKSLNRRPLPTNLSRLLELSLQFSQHFFLFPYLFAQLLVLRCRIVQFLLHHMDISQGLVIFRLGSSFSLFLSHTFLLSYLVYCEDTLHFQTVGSKFIQGFFTLVLTPILENFLTIDQIKLLQSIKGTVWDQGVWF